MKKVLIVTLCSMQLAMVHAGDSSQSQAKQEESTWGNFALRATVQTIGGLITGTQVDRPFLGAAAGFMTAVLNTSSLTGQSQTPSPEASTPSAQPAPAVIGTPAEDPEKTRERQMAEQKRQTQAIQAEHRTIALEHQLPTVQALGNRTILVPAPNPAAILRRSMQTSITGELAPADALHKLYCDSGKQIYTTTEKEKIFMKQYAATLKKARVKRGLRKLQRDEISREQLLETWDIPRAQEETKTAIGNILGRGFAAAAIRQPLSIFLLGLPAHDASAAMVATTMHTTDKKNESNTPPTQARPAFFDMGEHDTNALPAVGAPRAASPVPAQIQHQVIQPAIEIREVEVGKLPTASWIHDHK